jgi:hypothetical protein
MSQINNTKKPCQFDGTNYPYWKAKITTFIKSINRKVWKVVETKFEVADPGHPTAAEEILLLNNDIGLSAIHEALDEKTFQQIKGIEIAHDAWKKLEESFEGTKSIKGSKAYILKEKFASFKMKEDESVLEMFHRLESLVNDLKGLGEKVEDKDFSHKFLRCLPARFGMLVTLLVKTSLDTMTPNQILRDIMTDDAYRDDDEKEEKKEEKKDEKDEKKKSAAFKALSSSKGKAKQESSSDDDSSFSLDKLDDEKMALFVKKFDKFMMKKGYCARRKKSSSRNREETRRCFKCGRKDHLIAQCPYNSENKDSDDKKSKKYKKEKKVKKDKKGKKKGGSYVVTWDSDASSSDDDSSDDDKTTKKKAIASIAINEKPSLFDTPSCFMVKAIMV